MMATLLYSSPSPAKLALLKKQILAANEFMIDNHHRAFDKDGYAENHCWWVVDKDCNVDIVHGDDLSVEQGAALWNKRVHEDALVINAYPGFLGFGSTVINDATAQMMWADAAWPMFLRGNRGVLEGVVIGPLHGEDERGEFVGAVAHLSGEGHGDGGAYDLVDADDVPTPYKNPWELLIELSGS